MIFLDDKQGNRLLKKSSKKAAYFTCLLLGRSIGF